MTKIQKRYLQAIEEGNTDILPGRFYARAFVKQYADIVGLDGEELLEEHLTQTSKEASEEFAENVKVPTRTQGKKNDFLSDISEHLPTILIFLLVATIILVIYFAWRDTPANNSEQPMINEENTEQVVNDEAEIAEELEENGDSQEDAAADEETENAEENENTEETEEEEETTEEQSVSVLESTGTNTVYEVQGPHPENQNVTLTANGGETWVSITVAGGESNSGMLTDGDSLEVNFGPDATQVDIVVGNAPVTEVRLNDTELDYAPEAASVVRQDLQLQFVE